VGRIVKQGDIYWYTFNAPDKRRPVLLLTRNSAIPLLTGITVAPVTTVIRNIPSEVLLTAEEDGVPEDCVVNTDNIQIIFKPYKKLTLAHSLHTYHSKRCVRFARRLHFP